MKKLILVEDDELFALEVKIMLDEAFDAPAILHFTSGNQVLASIESFRPDIMLLDMILEDEKASLIVAEIAAQAQIPVIFMTAYNREDLFQMALKVNPYNFLQKPFTAQRLQRAIELALAQSRRQRTVKSQHSGEYVLLKSKENTLEKVSVNDIFLLEAFGNYCHIHTTERRFTHRMALKNYPEFIKSDQFVRIHRNYVLNIEFLDLVNTRDFFVVVAGQEYPISQRYKKDLLQKFPKL